MVLRWFLARLRWLRQSTRKAHDGRTRAFSHVYTGLKYTYPLCCLSPNSPTVDSCLLTRAPALPQWGFLSHRSQGPVRPPSPQLAAPGLNCLSCAYPTKRVTVCSPGYLMRTCHFLPSSQVTSSAHQFSFFARPTTTKVGQDTRCGGSFGSSLLGLNRGMRLGPNLPHGRDDKRNLTAEASW